MARLENLLHGGRVDGIQGEDDFFEPDFNQTNDHHVLIGPGLPGGFFYSKDSETSKQLKNFIIRRTGLKGLLGEVERLHEKIFSSNREGANRKLDELELDIKVLLEKHSS